MVLGDRLTALLGPLASVETVSAFTSVTLTAPPLPLLAVKLTVLKSLLALFRAMSPLPVAVKLLAPLTLLAPDWVMPPPALMVRLLAVMAPKARALVSVTDTAWPVAEMATAPKALLALVSVTEPPAETNAPPGTPNGCHL